MRVGSDRNLPKAISSCCSACFAASACPPSSTATAVASSCAIVRTCRWKENWFGNDWHKPQTSIPPTSCCTSSSPTTTAASLANLARSNPLGVLLANNLSASARFCLNVPSEMTTQDRGKAPLSDPAQNLPFSFAGAKLQLYPVPDGRVLLDYRETRLEHSNTQGG